MRLTDYPVGQIAMLAGLDAMGNVIRSATPPYHVHDTGGAYAPADHNHDTIYSSISHVHDTTYSGIDHNHDAIYSSVGHTHSDYAPMDRALSGFYLAWQGGQSLPAMVTISNREVDFTAMRSWIFVHRESDNYLFWARLYSGIVVNVPNHAALGYYLETAIQSGRTYLVMPSGASALNVSGAYYNALLVGGPGI